MKHSWLRASAAAIAATVLAITHVRSEPDTSVSSGPASAAVDRRLGRGQYLAQEALSYRGARYAFGGNGRNGLDCSGLTQSVARAWGLMLPRTSTAQYKRGRPVPRDKMVPGDLVFFKNTYKRGISHVGIYIGEGRFLHAASRRRGVIVSSLSDPYYLNRWAGARRLDLTQLPPAEAELEPDEPPG